MYQTSKKNKAILEELKTYGDILPKKQKGKSTKPLAKSVAKIVKQERLVEVQDVMQRDHVHGGPVTCKRCFGGYKERNNQTQSQIRQKSHLLGQQEPLINQTNLCPGSHLRSRRHSHHGFACTGITPNQQISYTKGNHNCRSNPTTNSQS